METLKDSLNKISDALALMNSMILSGERHSDQSTKMFYEAEKAISELSRLKDEGEDSCNVFLIHQEGNTTRLYKNGVKISPEKFTKFYGCEMTDEQKKLLKIAEENYFKLIEQSDKLTAEDLIKTIVLDKANLEYIAKTGVINGTLYIEIKRVIKDYASQFVGEKVTDEMIEKWAKEVEIETEDDLSGLDYMILAAKALRDGLIK